ncbi:hypothetical protein F5884DRAFT_805599 [Xylogone sp. PMI_703]|nr:hypothetical protein F5884DRAFT_805599 [Xylogone sp. PMI_703]
MSSGSNFVWVNKTQDSSSLSHSQSEKPILRQIRSHIRTAAHKSSRVRRPIERKQLNFTWIQKKYDKTSDRIKQQEQFSCIDEESTVKNPSLNHPLSGVADPFSAYSIKLDAIVLDRLWYLQNIWSQSAFKIPGCVGYGQPPLDQHEAITLIRRCLTSTVHSYCLLAATSARMQYLHYQDEPNDGYSLAHGYARRGLHQLRQQIENYNRNMISGPLSEEVTTDVIFLAAYEIFCCNDAVAKMHLAAVRRLYRQNLSNEFIARLRGNLELLADETYKRILWTSSGQIQCGHIGA